MATWAGDDGLGTAPGEAGLVEGLDAVARLETDGVPMSPAQAVTAAMRTRPPAAR